MGKDKKKQKKDKARSNKKEHKHKRHKEKKNKLDNNANVSRNTDQKIKHEKVSQSRENHNKKSTEPNKREMLIPMSKEQYDLEQSVVREVYDSQTNRMRLVKGSGEIIERIVTKDQHQAINRNATRGDGASFLASSLLKSNPNLYRRA